MANARTVKLEWLGEGLRFHGGGTDPQTPPITLDPKLEEGPSPMDVVLVGCAGCAGADVVSILKKMQMPLDAVSIEVTGERREEHPKRYTAIKYLFRVAGGDGLERSKVERAVSLSLEKYCSVLHSLAPDIPVDHEIELL